MQKIIFGIIVCAVVLLLAPAGLAMEPFGTPAAGLAKGQFGVGIDYSHTKENLKVYNSRFKTSDGESGKTPGSWKINNYKTDIITAKIGYGLADNLEGFVRVGGFSSDNATSNNVESNNNTSGKFYGDTDLALGAGAKATFWQQDNLKLGGLFQFSWAKQNTKTAINWGPDGIWSYDTDVRYMQVQFAVGPTYQLADWISVYGGPFLRYVRADFDSQGSDPEDPTYSEKIKYDAEQANYFGGFIGTQLEFIKNVPVSLEWQHTASDDAFGMNVTFKF